MSYENSSKDEKKESGLFQQEANVNYSEVSLEDTVENAVSSEKTGVRSYFTDVDDVMHEGQTGTMAKVLKDTRDQEAKKEKYSPVSRKNLAYMIVGATLFFASLVVLFYAVTIRTNTKRVPIQKNKPVFSLVRADAHALVNVANSSPSKISAEMSENLKNYNKNDVLHHVYFTREIDNRLLRLKTQQFFDVLGIKLPQKLSVSLNPDFMYGVFVQKGDQLPFLLFTIDSFDRAFEGMRTWESEILDDLQDVLNIPEHRLDPDVFNQSFETRIIDNQNTQVLIHSLSSGGLVDSENNSTESDMFEKVNQNDILMLYTFLSENVLLVTQHPAVVEEIKKRIDTQQIFAQ